MVLNVLNPATRQVIMYIIVRPNNSKHKNAALRDKIIGVDHVLMIVQQEESNIIGVIQVLVSIIGAIVVQINHLLRGFGSKKKC